MHSLGVVPRAANAVMAWRNGRAVTWQELRGRIGAWRAVVESCRGSKFALFLADAVEFAAALFGSWYAGKTIYLPADNLPGTCANLSLSVDGFLGEFAAEWQPRSAPGNDSGESAAGFHRLDPEFVGLVVFTSGSTGAPQAIAKKLLQLANEVKTQEQLFGASLGQSDFLSTASHQHIYGLLFNILWPLATGRPMAARHFAFFEELISALSTREWTLISSPAHLKRLADHPAWPEASLRLRAVFSSGGPLPFETAQETKRILGRLPFEIYGSSETGGIAWRRQTTRADTAWTPFDGVRWRLDAETGAIEVRSPHLPDDAWFSLADRAVAAADNKFLLQGRIDRIAKIEGKRISLSAIEALLGASPLVAAARVITLSGARERVAAFIVLSANGRLLFAEIGQQSFNRRLRALLAPAIEAVGLPRRWRYLDALPVNAQGKTTYADLAALLDAAPARPLVPQQRVIEKSAERVVVEWVAPAELFYFDGHFPGRPILAGVVQLDWVIALGRQSFSLPPLFRAIQGLKFQRVIPPETPFIVELTHDAERAALAFKITSALGAHAKGRILFGAGDV